MGKRDFRHREPKKSKKDAKKISVTDIVPPPPLAVEVIKKGKREREEEE